MIMASIESSSTRTRSVNPSTSKALEVERIIMRDSFA
jgi:hypothetical protein